MLSLLGFNILSVSFCWMGPLGGIADFTEGALDMKDVAIFEHAAKIREGQRKLKGRKALDMIGTWNNERRKRMNAFFDFF